MGRKMPTVPQIEENWLDWLVKIGKIDSRQDYERGQCFACGMIYAHPPVRAHIVPRFISKDDTVSNIHLLCHGCHAMSEYIEEKTEYFSWFFKVTNWDGIMAYGITTGAFTPTELIEASSGYAKS